MHGSVIAEQFPQGAVNNRCGRLHGAFRAALGAFTSSIVLFVVPRLARLADSPGDGMASLIGNVATGG